VKRDMHIDIGKSKLRKIEADTVVYTESPRGMVAFGGRPGPLRTPPEASQAAKLAPHGPLGMAKTDIYFSHQ
jgi:hypothetical protein